MIYVIDHKDSFTHNVVHQLSLFDKVKCTNYDEINIRYLKRASTIVLSPGPGSPKDYPITSRIYKNFKGKKRIVGICLGFQLMCLASDAKTFKMKFGHHGANHPVIDVQTKKVSITSQNHGFAVDMTSLTNNHIITHKSLFDDSLQGVELRNAPAYGFQGHPEASPGPQDIYYLFEKFIDYMSKIDA